MTNSTRNSERFAEEYMKLTFSGSQTDMIAMTGFGIAVYFGVVFVLGLVSTLRYRRYQGHMFSFHHWYSWMFLYHVALSLWVLKETVLFMNPTMCDTQGWFVAQSMPQQMWVALCMWCFVSTITNKTDKMTLINGALIPVPFLFLFWGKEYDWYCAFDEQEDSIDYVVVSINFGFLWYVLNKARTAVILPPLNLWTNTARANAGAGQLEARVAHIKLRAEIALHSTTENTWVKFGFWRLALVIFLVIRIGQEFFVTFVIKKTFPAQDAPVALATSTYVMVVMIHACTIVYPLFVRPRAMTAPNVVCGYISDSDDEEGQQLVGMVSREAPESDDVLTDDAQEESSRNMRQSHVEV